MKILYPDAKLVISETDLRCRLGLVVRDENSDLWGLTARYLFGGRNHAEIKDGDGKIVGRYDRSENEGLFAPDDIAWQIARFRLEAGAIDPERIGYTRIWPREVAEEGSLLRLEIASIVTLERSVGTIVEVGCRVEMIFDDAAPVIANNAILLSLRDPTILAPGQAGTLLMSSNAEAVGLGIAVQSAEYSSSGSTDTEVIAAPLAPYLAKVGLKPWAPAGAHWTDLERRAESFFNQIRGEGVLDLGPVPTFNRKGKPWPPRKP